MDENVVFGKNQGNTAPPGDTPQEGTDQSEPATPVTAEGTEDGATREEPQTFSAETPQEELAPQLADGGRNGLIKKILIGVGVFALIGLLIFLFLPKQQTTKNVKLVWWGLWEESGAMQTIINDFERTNPTIQVEYIKQDPKQYRDRLTSRIDNGTGPDIFRYHNTWLPLFQDVLIPLSSDVITADDFTKTYYPVMQEDLVREGAIYGIPLGSDTLAMFVNTQLLEAAGVTPPTNWDDFTKVAKKMTVKDAKGNIKTAGAAMGTYGNITHAPDIISLLFKQQGVDLMELKKSTEAEIEALTFYTGFGTGKQNVWDSRLDESLLAFSKGDVALYFGYSWDVFRIQRLNKGLLFTIHPVPDLYGKNTTIASYWVEGISKKSKHQKEALLFMQHLAKKETAQKFYTAAAKTREFGEPPARIDLADSVKENKYVYPFVQQMPTAKSSLFTSDTHDGEGGINSLANTYLGDTVNGMVNDHDSAESAVEKLNTGIKQVLEKYEL